MKRFVLLFFLSISLLLYGASHKGPLIFEMKEIDSNLIVLTVGPEKKKINKEEGYPYHKVRKNEYLSEIAHIYHKKTKKLVEINELKNPNLIYPAQKIYLERKKKVNMEEVPKYHIVKKGENIISISFTYDLDWKNIKKLNNLENITDIYPGQKIILK